MIEPAALDLFRRLEPLTPDQRQEHLHALREQGSVAPRVIEEARRLINTLDQIVDFDERTGPPDSGQAGSPGASSLIDALPAGASIAGYTIVRMVGRGGMGVVYEARQDFPQRRVALKLIRADQIGPDRVRRFRREAQSLARLDHPGIATIYEARIAPEQPGGEPFQPFIAMQFVDGQSITQYARERSLPVADRVRLVMEVADALRHAHEHQVFHRDVSPSNILVGNDGRPVLVDFGVALISDPALVTLATIGEAVIGKWPYCSPEQTTGRSEIGPRADVYALGAVLDELLRGAPWLDTHDRHYFDLLRAVQHQRPAPLPPLRCRNERDLRAVVTTAMAPRPEWRYLSAAYFRDDLRRWLEAKPVWARPPGAARQLHEAVRARPRLVLAVAAAIIGLMIGLTFATAEAVRANRAEARVLSTVQSMIERLVAELSSSRASAAARLRSLEVLEEAVESLARESRKSPEVRATLARYHLQRALALGGPYNPNLSRHHDAVLAYQQAIDAAGAGHPPLPGDDEPAWAATDARAHMAEMLMMRGEEEPSIEQFRLAMHECQERAAASADPLRWWNRAAMCATLLASSHHRRGDSQDAREAAAYCQALIERAKTAPPSRDPSCVHADISLRAGRAWYEINEPARALPLLREAREGYHSRLSPDAPIEDWFDYIDTFRYEGRSLESLGRFAEAVAAMDSAVELIREQHERRPDRSDGVGALADTLARRAVMRAAQHDTGSLDDVREAIALREMRFAEERGTGISRRALDQSLLLALDVVERLQQSQMLSDALVRSLEEYARSVAARRAQLAAQSSDDP